MTGRKTNFRSVTVCSILPVLFLASTVASIAAQPLAAQTAAGQQPAAQTTPATAAAADAAPTLEFVFEEVVTLDKAVNVGDTPLGHRMYIPITGGTVTGPKFNGKVLPGGERAMTRSARPVFRIGQAA